MGCRTRSRRLGTGRHTVVPREWRHVANQPGAAFGALLVLCERLAAGDDGLRSRADLALQSVALGLLDEHIAHCVADAVKAGGPEADAKLKEAGDAIARLVRS